MFIQKVKRQTQIAFVPRTLRQQHVCSVKVGLRMIPFSRRNYLRLARTLRLSTGAACLDLSQAIGPDRAERLDCAHDHTGR